MTNQEILNNAPEGAEYIDYPLGRIIWIKIKDGKTMYFREGIPDWTIVSNQNFFTKKLRSLADIRRIVELEGVVEAINEVFGGEDL